jgi:hypothetical protein
MKPQVSWMALLRNKKKTQMDGIAQIVSINHAALVIQVIRVRCGSPG